MASAFAQSENENIKRVTDRFTDFYNRDLPDSIFSMLDDNMKKALPLDKTKDFLAGLKAGAGKITGRQLTKNAATYAVYKTTFEHTVFALVISLDNNFLINGLRVNPYVDESVPFLKRNTTKMALPFKDEWTVVWGGDTESQNYHVTNKAQKNAFDLLITDEKGSSHKTNGKTNEDYYAFGKEVLAPCDGEIVMAIDSVKDNIPGVMNAAQVLGNSVVIKTANNEFLFFAHFKQHSVKVKVGQQVKQGQLLGLCGNSGHSSEAHIHFHIQHVKDLNSGMGVKCFFDSFLVNGQVKTDYSPVQGEHIKPSK
jgi:hypothetical protein